MYHPAKRNHLAIFTLFLLIVSYSLLSCSDSVPKINSVNQSVIMDFSDEQSPAVVSLSVFIQSDSEVRKIDSLTLTNVNSSLSWTSRTIELLQGKNNKFWAGYSNFKAVQGTFFPQGRYTVLIEDKAGNESESSFILNIPEEIKKGDLKSIRAYLSGNSVQFLKNIAIYDDENNLLFLGEENENFSTDEQFIKKYPEGVKKRPVYLVNGGTVTILFPSEEINNQSSES